MTELESSIQRTSRIRQQVIAQIFWAGSGHPGGSLSTVDIIDFLFQEEVNKTGNHRFILSKGHAVPALYAAAAEHGWIEQAELKSFRKINSLLQGHPHVGVLPWVQTSTGSLGQGFSVAVGMAMGEQYQKKDTNVYVMLGDGEIQEGEIWEGAMCAAHYQLDHLCAILDYNKLQSDNYNKVIMNLEPLRQKWEAFGWNVLEVDGHDVQQIKHAVETFKTTKNQPTLIIAHTIKGKGVSYMENSPLWHGSVKMNKEETIVALKELGAADGIIRGITENEH